MLRFLFRFAGFWLTAAALVAAVVDGAKSIATSAFVTTPFAEVWALIAGSDVAEASATPVATSAPWPLDILLVWLFAAPAVAVFLVPGVLLLITGAKRKRHPLGREFAA